MEISSIIRKKRKECGLTQEQVANRLGVSVPAVSKWENGTTYPDITLLPVLARLLNTDLNILLGFHSDPSEEQVHLFLNDLMADIVKNGFEGGYAMCMEKIREYPNSMKLIHSSAMALQGSLQMSGLDAESKKRYKREIVSMYERVAASEDPSVKGRAAYMLASNDILNGEYEQAEQMLSLIPEKSDPDKRLLRADILAKQNKPEEASGILERKILSLTNEMSLVLMKLIDVQIQAENLQDADDTAQLSKEFSELFELGDYAALAAPLQAALGKRDAQESVLLLKAAFAALRSPWEPNRAQLYRHAFLSYEKSEEPKKDLSDLTARLIEALRKELEENEKYDFLRTNEEFRLLMRD